LNAKSLFFPRNFSQSKRRAFVYR